MNTTAYTPEKDSVGYMMRLALEGVIGGAIESFEIRRAPVVLSEYFIIVDKAGDEIRFAYDEVGKAIGYILSQHTETFEIKDIEDMRCIKEGAMGVLSNGEEFTVDKGTDSYINTDRVMISIGDGKLHVNLSVLMGASITQGKYKK